MHSSRMRTTYLWAVSHSIRWGGGLPNPFLPLDVDPHRDRTPPPRGRPPGGRPPWIQMPLDVDPPLDADSLVM